MAGELVCPMCQGATDPSAFDAMIRDLICERDLSEEAESVLRAVWAGGGRPVEAETIFDELYCWDPCGGPCLHECIKTCVRARQNSPTSCQEPD